MFKNFPFLASYAMNSYYKVKKEGFYLLVFFGSMATKKKNICIKKNMKMTTKRQGVKKKYLVIVECAPKIVHFKHIVLNFWRLIFLLCKAPTQH